MRQLNIPSIRPGFLVSPLGWVNERLADLLISHSDLLKVLFALDAVRMHALALGLAHYADKPSPALMRALASNSPQPALGLIIRCWPRGLDRALHVLPNDAVLSCESYRRLIVLLKDQPTARYLHHCRSITSPMLGGLAALPKPLRRPAIFKLFGTVEGMDRFVVALNFLSGRAGIPFDQFIDQLGRIDQAEQIMAIITDLAESLPLPDRLPCSQIGSFRRIDSAAEIRSLGKAWGNCLGHYLYEVNAGSVLVFVSTANGSPAAALLVRVHRLGWAVAEIKGPKNTEVQEEHLPRHLETFAAAGIPPMADIASVKDILCRSQFSRHAAD